MDQERENGGFETFAAERCLHVARDTAWLKSKTFSPPDLPTSL